MAAIFDFVSRWSWANPGPILNGIWIGLVLTVLVWLVLRKNLNLAASGRYLIWWTTLLAVLALPWLATRSLGTMGLFDERATALQGDVLDRPIMSEQDVQSEAQLITPDPADFGPVSTNNTPEVSAWDSVSLRSIPLLLTGVWVVVVLLCMWRLWSAHRSVVRIKKHSRPFDLRRFPGLRQRLESPAHRPVVVSVSSEIAAPMAAGLGQVTILIPDKVATALEPEDLESIILHELAHLTRWDDWTKLAQKLIETVFIFHPAVHLIGRQLELERELACDEWAVSQTGQVEGYACSLTRLAQLTNGGMTSLIPGALTGRKQIFKRFERLLLHAPTASLRRTRIGVLSLTAGVVVAAVVLSGVAPAITLPFTPLTLTELTGSSTGTPELAQNTETGTVTDSTDTTAGDTASASPISPSRPTAVSETQLQQLLTTLDLSPEVTLEADWEAEFKRGRPWLNFTFHYDRDSRSSFSLPVDSFVGIDESWRTEQVDDVRFLLIRGAGVFDFKGGFKRGFGEGEFEFRVREDYLSELDRLGYRVSGLDDFELYQLALFDVSGSFIREMEELGYEDLPLEQLISMRIHGVKTGIIRELRELGYDLSAERLVEFQIHGVTPWYIKDLEKKGITELSAERLVEFRIHSVDPADVAEFAEAGLTHLRAERLVEFRIHGVTPSFVRSLAELGYDNLPPERLVEFRIHGVTPEMISEFRDLGYRNLDPEELTTFKIHGVTPGFIRELAELGYKDIYPEDLVSMRIHGVSPSYIERLRGKGYDDLNVEDLIDMRIHGID
jgi:beta-lactamase regulating signal transducer with metallopeptidase domain